MSCFPLRTINITKEPLHRQTHLNVQHDHCKYVKTFLITHLHSFHYYGCMIYLSSEFLWLETHAKVTTCEPVIVLCPPSFQMSSTEHWTNCSRLTVVCRLLQNRVDTTWSQPSRWQLTSSPDGSSRMMWTNTAVMYRCVC